MTSQDPTELQSRFRTRTSLLRRARKPDDQDAWNEIFRIYSPLIYSVGRKAGLTRWEAEDVRQETMLSLSRNLPRFKYNRAKGQFRTWLARLTKWRIKDQWRKRRPQAEHASAPGDTRSTRTATVARIADPRNSDLEAIWDQELEQRRNQLALAELKDVVNPRHLQIFSLYVLNHWPVEKVAASLAVSKQQVYTARTRILPLFRKQVRRLKGRLL